MKEINLAQVLAVKRREKGVTQDELAAYIGVSKASVSKWETGQSYPDITFLPALASYFDISIDSLMNYSPQLTKPQIAEIYSRLAANFAKEPFEDVISECESLVKKYYSCYPFLLEIVKLYINHTKMAASDERQSELMQFSINLCERVVNNCSEASLTQMAATFQSMCHFMRGEPTKVLEILGENVSYGAKPSGFLISQSYLLLGKSEKAKEVMQADLYFYLMAMFDGLINYINSNIDDFEIAKTAFERTEKLAELFHMRRLNLNNVAIMYAIGAHVEQAAGNSEQAIKMLEKYVDVCVDDFFPFNVHSDDFFNKIDDWLAENTGTTPRDEALVKESMLDDVLLNPAFNSLNAYPEY